MFRKAILVFSVLCAAAVAAPPPANLAKAGMDPARLARIPQRMREFVDRGEVAGTVTLVQRHGVLAALEAVGYQDIEARKPMRTDTIFQLMSMTKPVTGVGIMILADEGRLTINDPVEKHLPEFRGIMLAEKRDSGEAELKKPSRAITIRDLMTHTSGINSRMPPSLKELNQKMDRTLAEAVAEFAKQPLEFEPGTKWQYSNAGIATLGRIIEAVSGQPYERFIEERIFKPLGMKDSFYFPPADKTDRIAAVYTGAPGKLVRSGPRTLGGDPMQFRKGAKYPAPEYGLFSTAPDLAAFYQMMLNGGRYRGARILSPAAVEVMTMLHTGDLTTGWLGGGGYGLTWEVVRQPLGTFLLMSVGTYSHGGAFGTLGWVDKKKDLLGVFLVQHSGNGAVDARNAFASLANAAVVD